MAMCLQTQKKNDTPPKKIVLNEASYNFNIFVSYVCNGTSFKTLITKCTRRGRIPSINDLL